LINEATDTLKEQGLNVDIRHIMLVSDIMTVDGDVKPIGRHGISGEKASVLARAAFEVTVNHLLDSGMRGMWMTTRRHRKCNSRTAHTPGYW